MTDREVMQMALDALEECMGWTHSDLTVMAADAIRARLAQHEENAFKPDWDTMAVMVEEQQRMAKRIEELEAQLAQQEEKPEPVAWLIDWPDEPDLGHYFSEDPTDTGRSQPLYTTPLQQEWQGLTDDEIDDVVIRIPLGSGETFAIARAIEAKLKEKNT